MKKFKEEIKESVEVGKCGETLKEIRAMTDGELQDNMRLCFGDTWKYSLEFVEVLRRKETN